MGRPAFVKPHGSDRPGSPARLHGSVHTSMRYMDSGSFTFSPSLKAGTGEVGVTSASTCVKALVKSSRMSVRTFCAFR